MNSLMSILFKQQHQLVPPLKQEELMIESIPYVLSFAKNVESYGFTISEALSQHLIRVPKETLIPWCQSVEEMLKDEVGLRSNMTPFYPNFPKQVMDSEDSEWIFNALCHYWSEGTYLPFKEMEREKFEPLLPNQTLLLLELGTEEDYFRLFQDKISHRGSLSQESFFYLEEMIEQFGERLTDYLPEDIPNRETFATLMLASIEVPNLWNALKRHIQNPTDILRLQQGLETNSVYLGDDYHFKGVNRSLRRQFMEILNEMSMPLLMENLWKREQMWKQWAKVTHTGEFKTKTPRAYQAFQNLREGKRPLSYQGKVNQLFEEKKHLEVSQLLMKRPTEMARALDRLLRLEYECFPLRENDLTSHRFGKVAEEVPSTVLIQVLSYFKGRSEMKTRFFHPQKNGKIFGLEEPLMELPEQWIQNICRVCECTLMERYEKEEAFESVYLDESLKQVMIPLVQRHTNPQLKPLAKGSRLTIDNQTNVLRPFVYWTNNDYSRIDLDLSVVILDEDFKTLSCVDYRHLRSEKYGIYHSGDITNGEGGATEYLEINLNTLKSTSAKYLTFSVQSFTNIPFDDLEDAFVGLMERDGVTGDHFEPSTVHQKANLTQNAEACLVLIYDIDKEEMIWADTSLNDLIYEANHVGSHSKTIQFVLRRFIEKQDLNLYQLLSLHIQARGGVLVEVENEAKTVFGGESGLQSHQFDQILAHYVK